MNKQSPIYKALEERGRSKQLPLGFSFEVMSRIRIEENRRKRINMWWAIVGYALAAILAASTLVCLCGDIFDETLHNFIVGFATDKSSTDFMHHNMIKSFESSWSSEGGMLAVLVPVTALLLTLDYFFRKKFTMRYKHKQT